jgi:DnaJ-class molecular chaperone
VKVLEVVIEPGTHPGTDMVFERECSDEPDYVEPGDVRIVFSDADEDIRFKRHTVILDDLVVHTKICLRDALTGCKETMQGHPGYPQGLVLEIPAGVQNKEHIEIPGKGMPKKGAVGAYGTLHLFVDVVAGDEERAALRGHKDLVEQIFKSPEA